MEDIYLDNSATTVVCKEACDKILEMLSKNYGNPSSLHTKGMDAERELIMAKRVIADFIKCKENEVYFTSGGTEANNIAILGACRRRKKLGNKIVASAVEHSSVIEPLKQLEKEGFEVVYIKPDIYGRIDEKDIEKEIDSNTILVSLMYVNNEVGAVNPVDKVKKIIAKKKSKAIFHMDAVQAFGKLDISVKKLDVDLMTITAHKIHGPKGVGALYIKKGVLVSPIVYGGEQESKIRPGTESIELIAGFSEAIKALSPLKEKYKEIEDIRNELIYQLKMIDGVKINSKEDGFAYIVNFSVPGIRSETMLHYLEDKGIYVSSGSACSKGKKSHVLSNLGISDELVDSALRVSFSRYNTKQDVISLAKAVEEGITKIKRR